MKLRFTALTVGLASLTTAAYAQTPVFNNDTSSYYWSGVGTGQNINEEGEWFQTSQAAPFSLGGFDLSYDSIGSNTYSNLQLEVQVYGLGVSTYTNLPSAEFTGLLYTTTYTLGAQTLSGAYDLAAALSQATGSEVMLPTPVTTTDSTGRIGIMFTWLDAGVAATNIETFFSNGGTPALGSNAETDYGFLFGLTGGNGTVSPNQNQYEYSGTIPLNLDTELWTATPAPEPVSMAFLGLGVVGLIARRRNRK